MENDKINKELYDEEYDSSNDSYYKPEFEGQTLNDNNVEFFKWKESMLLKYGKNAKLFKCLIDDIYFYTSDEDCKKYPIYQAECPKCLRNICFFCSRNIEDMFGENGTCCLSRKIKCMFYQDCYRFINPVHIEEEMPSYKKAFLGFIIPVLNLLTLITQIQGIYFYKLAMKNGEIKNGKVERYYLHLKIYDYVVFINIGIAFSLVIPLFIIYLYFVIFILLISIPFKFIPLKYILGTHYSTINLINLFL